MEADFHKVHDHLTETGLSDRSAAGVLLGGADEPQVAVLVDDAVVAGWPVEIARRAVLRLAKCNMERVTRPR